MITAVDSNVLLDVFAGDPAFAGRSLAALRACLGEGPLVASEVVWAEVIGAFPSAAAGRTALEAIPVAFDPLDRDAATLAGDAWRRYRAVGGPRTRVIADFLVGAHARVQADRLLTRDRGFQRDAYADLVIVDPST